MWRGQAMQSRSLWAHPGGAHRFHATRTATNQMFWASTAVMTFPSPASYSTQSNEQAMSVKPVAADIIRKARYRSIVDGLEKDSRVKMPVSEYLSICEQNQIDNNEAKELLGHLHDSGRFLHYPHSPQLRDVVLLKPDELALAFAKLLDIKGDFSKEFISNKEQALSQLDLEIAQLEQKKTELSVKAHKRADRLLTIGAIFLALQGFAVARLTWWELSWDIMEPVTYMLTFTAVLGGYVYFKFTNTDYTYEALRERLANKRLTKLMTKEGFDFAKLEDLKAQAQRIKQEIAAPEKYLLHGFDHN
eukprot:TRINITY_DN890_c0_g2_i1.p1 TRINITY_DN890_c0_g2~~TRINITY_DN890_c0_g2_i1.p1  ORF type:complete len:304 (-),score=70.20 TRINITY_DN890_c0_g2_i1:64-975(-)